MQLRAGYKRTELGVIPDDWSAVKAGDLGHFRGGNGFPTRLQGARSGDFPFYKVSDMNNEGNDTFMLDSNNWISEAVRKEIGATVFPANSIVFAKVGAAIFLERKRILSKPSCLDNNLAAFVLDSDKVESRFLHYMMLSIKLGALVSTTALPSLSNKVLTELRFALPPLVEQHAIAAALSDVDALIGTLDKLIAKKRDLKKAAMQQLLTGQTRLPGFSGEWEVKRLGDLGSTYGGLTGKTKADFGRGSSRYITFMNVMTGVVIDCGAFEQVAVGPGEKQNRAKRGDLFFNGSSETPEEVGMCAALLDDVHDVFLNSFCFGFRLHDYTETSGLYLAYYFRSMQGRELLKALAQGATRYNLSKKALLKISFPCPSAKEQTAIATVLSDMEAELAALTARRDKTRALKQGMMQELLTGRIRLM